MRGVLLLIYLTSLTNSTFGVPSAGGKTYAAPDPSTLHAANSPAYASQTNQLVELKGRVVPILNTTNLQFQVEGEKRATYNVLPSRDAKALFADTNLHAKVLLVKGRLHPKASALEIVGNLHTVKNGEVYELYYYCDICSIETSFPGPCLCCREDVILLERRKK